MTKQQLITLIVLGISTGVTLACGAIISATPIEPDASVLTEDGIYIVGNSNTYEKIPAVDDDSVF
jgi:hypothetical protein